MDKQNQSIESELYEAYASLTQYRRALIFVVKQMTPEQRDLALKSCKEEIYGAVLGATMVAKIPQNVDKSS